MCVHCALCVRSVDLVDACAAWVGGATLAASVAFEPQWVTRKQYDEDPARALRDKPPVGF